MICLCLHLPWDQDSNDNMAEVASTQPQGWGTPDITGGLLLQVWRGEGGVPSGLCPPAVPGHHQHGPACRNHHPGRAHGDRERAAQGVGNNLRHKTKITGETEGLSGQNTEMTRRTNSPELAPFPCHILCLTEKEKMLIFTKCLLCAEGHA